MRLIIEARIEGDDIDPTDIPIPLAVIDRRDDDLEQAILTFRALAQSERFDGA